MTQIWDADTDALPIGTVLPFKPGEVPDDFIPWNGFTILGHPELIALLENTPEILELWEQMGGKRISDGVWQTPRVSGPEAWETLGLPNMGFHIILAQKAKRTVSSDAANTEASEVRDDDPDDGQFGEQPGGPSVRSTSSLPSGNGQ